MVRFAVSLCFVAAGLLLVGAAQAAQEQKDTDGQAAPPAKLSEDYLPRPLETPLTRVTTCELCAGLTCATVRVRGRCTMDKAVEALREKEADRRVPQDLRHRDRAISKADFQPIAAGNPAGEVGRARAEPRHAPTGHGGTAERLLEIYENSGRSLSVRERNSLSVKAQSFRPLDLSEEASDEEKSTNGQDE